MSQGTPCSSQLIFCEQQLQEARKSHAEAMQRAFADFEKLRKQLAEAVVTELAKPEPEPVAWLCNGFLYLHGAHDMRYIEVEGVPLYRKEDL